MEYEKPHLAILPFLAEDKWLRDTALWHLFDFSKSRHRLRRVKVTMNATGLERVRWGNLLYTDEVGHDACGIGGVAARDGKPSAEVLRKAVTALKAMEHRGGVCG